MIISSIVAAMMFFFSGFLCNCACNAVEDGSASVAAAVTVGAFLCGLIGVLFLLHVVGVL